MNENNLMKQIAQSKSKRWSADKEMEYKLFKSAEKKRKDLFFTHKLTVICDQPKKVDIVHRI